MIPSGLSDWSIEVSFFYVLKYELSAIEVFITSFSPVVALYSTSTD